MNGVYISVVYISMVMNIAEETANAPINSVAVTQGEGSRPPALGGEVYASTAGEKVFYHTCKSNCCASCGNRGTQLWQREQ